MADTICENCGDTIGKELAKETGDLCLNCSINKKRRKKEKKMLKDKLFIGLSEPNPYGVRTFTLIDKDDVMVLSGNISKKGIKLLKHFVPSIEWPKETKGLF